MDLIKRTKIEHYYYDTAVGTQAPLTTVWTEPASCVSAIPTISAGLCDTASCSAYPPASVESILSYEGVSVNYPEFTTALAQISTECMPSGYANLGFFYFTGGTQCPLSWTTATVANESNYKTIACCPPAYPSPVSNSKDGNYDCYTISQITASQQFILAAKGAVPSSQPTNSESSYLDYWESESIIGTTQWPAATTAYLYHPGVNFLVQLPTSTPGSSSGNSASNGSSSFSIDGLGLGGSIGMLVGIAVVGIVCLACLFSFFRRFCGPRRRPPPLSTAVYQPPGSQYVPPIDG